MIEKKQGRPVHIKNEPMAALSGDEFSAVSGSGPKPALKKPAVAQPVPIAEAGAAELKVREALREAARLVFGKGNLPINPATGKRWYGTGKVPVSGINSPMLVLQDDPPRTSTVGRFEGRQLSRRERVNALEERMHTFSSIYNAGYMVRDSYFGPDARQREKVMVFLTVFVEQIGKTDDYEALLFAVADTLYRSPHGVPWEP